jgi:hypothetical protein
MDLHRACFFCAWADRAQVESGGTVLSTNWDEVGKGEVKVTPPPGLEVHSVTENVHGRKTE